jgi:hypothetical protein
MAQQLNALAVIVAIACVVACGGSQPASSFRLAPSAPPAGELLSRSQSSNLNDFHITYTAHLWAEGPLSRLNSSITVRSSGAGSVVVGPKLMAELHETSTFCADLCPVDLIVVDGDRYSKSGSSSWWLDHGVAADSYLWSMVLPSRLAKAIAPRVVGEETLDGVETWVVSAIDPSGHSFRVWFSQKDGYPVQLESAPNEKTSFLDLHVNLDHFNTGVVVAAPPEDQLDPVFWGTEYVREHPIPLAGGTVTIHIAGYDCNGADTYDDSRSDVYFVLVPFTYAAEATALTIDPGLWTLYDTFGHPYRAEELGTAPRLVMQTIPPGQSRSGDLCFLVPWSEDRLTIVGDFPSGVVTSFVGGLQPPDSVSQVAHSA